MLADAPQPAKHRVQVLHELGQLVRREHAAQVRPPGVERAHAAVSQFAPSAPDDEVVALLARGPVAERGLEQAHPRDAVHVFRRQIERFGPMPPNRILAGAEIADHHGFSSFLFLRCASILASRSITFSGGSSPSARTKSMMASSLKHM